MKYFLFIKRSVTIEGVEASGATNFFGDQKLGARLLTILSANASVVKGFMLNPVLTGLVNVRKGLTVTTSASGESLASTNPALNVTARADNPTAATGVQGTDVVQVVTAVEAARTLSGSVAYTFGGRSDWATPANMNGARNGTLATFAGSALGARSGGVRGSFGTYSGKTDLTISKIEMKVYMSATGNPDLKLGYQTSGGVQTQVASINSAASDLTVPRVYDITSATTDWAQIPTLIAAFYATASVAILSTATANIDAVELVVTASQTTIQ